MECRIWLEESHTSPSYNEENVHNLFKLMLERSERMTEGIEPMAHANNKMAERYGKPLCNNSLTQETEEQEEESIPSYNNNSCEAHTTYMECDFERDAQLRMIFNKKPKSLYTSLNHYLNAQ